MADETPVSPRKPASEPQAATGADANGGTTREEVEPMPVIDTLREQYAKAGEDRRETIPITPGRFNNMIAARYKPIPYSERRRRVRRLMRGGGADSEEGELQYGSAIVADACECIMLRPAPGEPYRPAHEQTAVRKALGIDGTQPIRYDSNLAKLVGVELHGGEDAGAIVRLVFLNAASLDDHFAWLDAWLKEARAGDEDEDEDERPT